MKNAQYPRRFGTNKYGGAMYEEAPYEDARYKRSYAPKNSIDDEVLEYLDYINNFKSKLFRLKPVLTDEDYKGSVFDNSKYAGMTDEQIHGQWDTQSIKRFTNPFEFRDLDARWNQERRQHRAKGNSFDTYLKEVGKFLAADTEALSNMDYTKHIPKFSPMSMLKQRQRELEAQKTDRPYKNKIDKLRERALKSPGFDDDQITDMVNSLRNEGLNTSENLAKRFLDEEFQDNYKTRGSILQDLSKIPLDRNAIDNKKFLNFYSQNLGNTQSSEDIELANLFENAGQNKKQNKDILEKALGKFAAQYHTHGNLKDQEKEKTKDIEAALPYFKNNKLRNDINGIQIEPDNPGGGKNAMNLMNKALVDAGVNPAAIRKGKAADMLKDQVPMTPDFPEGLIEEITPEMQQSYYTLQGLNPKYSDADARNTRKDITKELYGTKDTLNEDLKNKTLGNIVYNKAKGISVHDFSNIDSELKEALEQKKNQIANKYIRLNQYGSPQQIRDTEEAFAKINGEFNKRKESTFSENLKHFEKIERDRMLNQRNLLSGINRVEYAPFDAALNDIIKTNESGVEKWRNKQNARNAQTNAKLGALDFRYPADALRGKLQMFIQPTHEANYQKHLDEYIKRKPFSLMPDATNLSINNMPDYVPFDETTLENDDYARNNKGTLQFEHTYDPRVRADKAQSESKYSSQQGDAKARAKKIREDAEAARNTALANANIQNPGKVLDDPTYLRLRNLVDNLGSGGQELLERIGRLIEESVPEETFEFNPYVDPSWRTSDEKRGTYKPRERARILQVANRLLGR